MQEKSAQLFEDFQKIQQEEQQTANYTSTKQSNPIRSTYQVSCKDISIDEEIQNLKNLQLKVNKTFGKTSEKQEVAEEEEPDSPEEMKPPAKQFRYNSMSSQNLPADFNNSVSNISNHPD